MTFEQLKTEILNRVKRLELCDLYQSVQVATTRPQLLTIGAALYTWVYQSGVVDDALLLEFSDAELNAAGIYRGTTTLSNPANDVYLVTGANVTIMVSSAKFKVVAMSNSQASILAGTDCFVDVKSFDSSLINVTLNNNASAQIEGVGNSQLIVEAIDESACQIRVTDSANLDFTGAGNNYSRLRAFNNSTINYSTSGAAEVDVNTYQNAAIGEAL